MSRFFKKSILWVILIALIIITVSLINARMESNKSKDQKSQNNPHQKTPQPPSNDNPEDNSEPVPPADTESWWLTDEEIEHAYSEIRKGLGNYPEVQLVSPSVARVIQEGGEISEDLKKAKYIFFPNNNSVEYETAGAGSHWTLLVFLGGESGVFENYNSLENTTAPENAMKVARNFHKKAELSTLLLVENVKEIPRQTNNADCGVYVIAYTRALTKKYKEKQQTESDWISISIDEKDLIFSIAEERQKLKAAGFPKKGTPGKDYEIGDDIDYRESEEELISQWWPKPDIPFHPLRKKVRAEWNLDIEEEASQPHDHADNFKEFSKKVRLLSGVSKIEKEKLAQIYRIKKILKYCSLPLEEYKKTKYFNGKDNFSEDKMTSEDSKFVKENINPETVKEINNLYTIHFPG